MTQAQGDKGRSSLCDALMLANHNDDNAMEQNKRAERTFALKPFLLL
jgi:hypothetical protein